MLAVVPITDEDVQAALVIEAKINAATAHYTTYTELQVEGANFVGAVCETGFARYLDWRGIPYEALGNVDGYADKGDFCVRFSRSWLIDVKGTPRAARRTLMVPVVQWEKKVQWLDILVAAQYLHPNVYLRGWIFTDKFFELMQYRDVVIPTYLVGYDKLSPMETLFAPKGE
jgi:hypothetical protein